MRVCYRVKGYLNKEYLNRWNGFNIDCFYIMFVDILGWLGCNVDQQVKRVKHLLSNVLILLIPQTSLYFPHTNTQKQSDLRVRHREETKVVSRLTMENMNLASRCREAISQVAALKKEVLVYQKKQSEWSTLQKEVMALRKQIDKNTTGGGSSGGGKKDKELSSSNAGSPGSSLSLNGHHKKQPSGGSGIGINTNNLENNNADRSDSPATDLDRIMSRQFRKNVIRQEWV